jgi:hypothetical protein
MHPRAALALTLLTAAVAAPALAGFAGTDLFVPMVGRGIGVYPSNWFTTLWVYNPNDSAVSVDISFLERQKNNVTTPPPKVTIPVAAGETVQLENIVEDTFGKTVFGALRVECTEKVVASVRVYSKESASAPLSQSFGQDFAAVPASFAIGLNESTEILGGYQTQPHATSEARFNIGCVETTGNQVTVRWSARDGMGVEQDTYERTVPPLSQVQGAFKDYFPAVSLTNSRITASVVSGTGELICYGSMITNDGTLPKPVQDPTTFEMTYKDELLGGGSGSGLSAVSHDTSLTGDGTSGSPLGVASGGISSTHLAGASVTPDKISASGSSAGQVLTSDGTNADWQTPSSGGTGLSAVVHDATMSGSGTAGSPLTIASGGVDTTQLADAAVTTAKLAGNAVATANIADNAVGSAKIIDSSIGQQDLANGAVTAAKLSASGSASGQVLTSSGAAVSWQNPGGFTLPYSGGANSAAPGFQVTNSGVGVRGESTGVNGVAGASSASAGNGVYGTSSASDGFGVSGRNTTNGNWGFLGGTSGFNSAGVYGEGGVSGGDGVRGFSSTGSGVFGMTSHSTGVAVGAYNSTSLTWAGLASALYAGEFLGAVGIIGHLTKSSGSFKIDHPLDPENKYLYHSFVESPDMMNIYNGNVITDEDGRAVVELPEWFDVLNRDFRYQLTVIGRFAQAIVEQEIEDSRFTIRTNLASVKVSWQVTGIRQDAWANAHRIVVEADKPEAERGRYLHPEAYGLPAERGIAWERGPATLARSAARQ